MTTYHCNRCDTAIFTEADRVGEANLWDLGDYQARVHVLRPDADTAGLRRYDASLHEGWYCCRFVMMRMVVDKFGTGDALLVYQDAVTAKSGETTTAPSAPPAAVVLTERDHDAVLASPALRGRLAVVKLGAIWCPPCRLMDAVIERLVAADALPDVSFFEVDIDAELGLAGRFRNQSIPYTRFYFDGRLVPVTREDGPVVDGGLIGGIGQATLQALCEKLLARSRAGAAV